VAAGASPPTLRLFRWAPACLSIGYFQPVAQADATQCARRGIDLVRRPTGGSAILHDDELTYSVAARESNSLVSGDILSSYRKIAAALLQGLRQLGVPATLADSPGSAALRKGSGALLDERPAPCFTRPSDFELLANGKKLVGSAQVRRGGALLQHGSVPLGGDVTRIAQVLRLSAEERAATVLQLRSRATTLADVLTRQVTCAEAASALLTGFIQAWGIELRMGVLSETENRDAHSLLSGAYATTAWTRRR
jgi:lipoate-protein ligase A